MPEAQANYIEDPDLSAVVGQPQKYWEITGDSVSLADPATQAAIDAQETSDKYDELADQIDDVDDLLRAFAQAVLDEINLHATRITAILDAIDGASNLSQVKTAVGAIPDVPTRTIAQMKTATRNKLGS